MSPSALNPDWFSIRHYIYSFLCLIVALLFLAASVGILYLWKTATYQERTFIPYRTALAEIMLGFNFSAGVPQIEISMEQFRKESAGKPYFMSYDTRWTDPKWNRWRTDSNLKYVSYSMRKSTSAGDINLLARERIPDYYKHGTTGFKEDTAFDSTKLVFYSVNMGTSYWVVLSAVLFALIAAGFWVATAMNWSTARD